MIGIVRRRQYSDIFFYTSSKIISASVKTKNKNKSTKVLNRSKSQYHNEQDFLNSSHVFGRGCSWEPMHICAIAHHLQPPRSTHCFWSWTARQTEEGMFRGMRRLGSRHAHPKQLLVVGGEGVEYGELGMCRSGWGATGAQHHILMRGDALDQGLGSLCLHRPIKLLEYS